MSGFYEKALVQCRAFGKLQNHSGILANQRPYRIAETAEAGNFFIPYQLQSLVKDGCCEPGFQLDSLRHRKKQGDFLVLEVIHGLVLKEMESIPSFGQFLWQAYFHLYIASRQFALQQLSMQSDDWAKNQQD
jgi:hypothetical protein